MCSTLAERHICGPSPEFPAVITAPAEFSGASWRRFSPPAGYDDKPDVSAACHAFEDGAEVTLTPSAQREVFVDQGRTASASESLRAGSVTLCRDKTESTHFHTVCATSPHYTIVESRKYYQWFRLDFRLQAASIRGDAHGTATLAVLQRRAAKYHTGNMDPDLPLLALDKSTSKYDRRGVYSIIIVIVY
jgi:hypothetical protein